MEPYSHSGWVGDQYSGFVANSFGDIFNVISRGLGYKFSFHSYPKIDLLLDLNSMKDLDQQTKDHTNERYAKGSIKLWGMPPDDKAHHVLGEEYFLHSNFEDYYYYRIVKGVKNLRHRFFLYENNKPFMFSNGTKVFVSTDNNNRFEYTFVKAEGLLDDDHYYFNIDKVVNFSAD